MNLQEIRAIREAYNQVYEQETGRGPRISDTYDMRDAEGGPTGGRTIRGPKIKNTIRKEETDLFDYLLEYLVAEGFADTNESALAIMANMSEEWRESIVEKYATFGYNADDPGDDFGQFVDKGPKTNKQKRNAIQLNNKILSKPGMLKGV